MTDHPSPGPPIVVRDALGSDMEAVRAVYAHHVLNGRATLEEVPPTTEEMAVRREAVLALGLPYLVAERDGRIVGYCYASTYRPRAGYRFTVEDSIYVADGFARRGIGSALLGALIERCEAGPWRQMLAVVGDGGNPASIHLHRRFGFEPVGSMKSVGYKLGRWVDVVVMQRSLGPGGSTPPAPV
ncbi:GNAT family N-acetyltransferase [Paludisphaera soli]|uniref:GNAT family N-acetyltransferase n=1 Tax=Paludisphaera soli TaxID=2712865 RepID=UPI0013EE0922|nr:GNAT family N-acetyltransferase [Paludisphaera soli]